MTVEEKRVHGAQFPVGLRVLAVDDDPVCLKLLESLLIRCQYNVTTTGQAITALKLLRENKNKFDLVISDVHMPDMDGFKLLELVGLEMDLPVIMLSANGEKQAVMKGITHGACDYLLKPVRIEELKNVWQHVIRRRKFDKRCQNYKNDLNDGEDGEKARIFNQEGSQQTSKRNTKLKKRRNDQNEDDEYDSEDDVQDSDDHSSQKKQRVVWTAELHRKFVTSVNQLGIDKAMPRKILDMMNVENITRENVASHLQKYRLYLKRLSVVNQQAKTTASFDARSSSYAQMTSLNGFRSYQPFGSSRPLPLHTSFQPNGILRMNGIQGVPPSQIVQHDTSLNVNGNSRFQTVSLPRNDETNLVYGMPTVLQSDESSKPRMLQEIKSPFTSSGVTSDTSPNSLKNGLNGSLLLHTSMQLQQPAELCNSYPAAATASYSHSLGTNFQKLSQFPRLYGCNDTGQVVDTSMQNSANSLLKHSPISQEATSVKAERKFHFASNANHSFNEYSNIMQVSNEPARCINAQNPVNSLVAGRINVPIDVEDPNSPNFRVDDDSMKRHHPLGSNIETGIYAYSSFPTLGGGLYDSKGNANPTSQSILDASSLVVTGGVGSQVLSMDEYTLDAIRLSNDLSSAGCSFDEFYAMIKQEQEDDKTMGGDFGSDIYSLGACN